MDANAKEELADVGEELTLLGGKVRTSDTRRKLEEFAQVLGKLGESDGKGVSSRDAWSLLKELRACVLKEVEDEPAREEVRTLLLRLKGALERVISLKGLWEHGSDEGEALYGPLSYVFGHDDVYLGEGEDSKTPRGSLEANLKRRIRTMQSIRSREARRLRLIGETGTVKARTIGEGVFLVEEKARGEYDYADSSPLFPEELTELL